MDKALQPSDAELVEAACNGDVDSFRCLYEKHYRLAVGIAYSRQRDIHLAEDAAQEAFAFACRKLHTLRNGDRFPEWLGTICRRMASKMSVRQPHRVPIRDQPTCENTIDETVDVEVRAAMERLSNASRELLTLHYFSGMSYEEIALSLRISSQAVHGRMQRARKKLAYYLSKMK